MEVMTTGKRPKFWKRLLLAYVEEKFHLSSRNKCVKIIITRLFSVICCLWYLLSCMPCKYMYTYTRMHSNRMRTACALTVSPSMLCTRGVSARGGVCSQGGVCSGWCLLWGGCLLQGVSALGGVCSRRVSAGGVCSRGCLLPGVSAPVGVCSGGCLLLGGVCSWGGMSAPGGSALGDLLQGGVCSRGGVCSGGVSAPKVGLSAPGGRGCLLPGGFQKPDPFVNRILDTRLWKYYLAPNFVCGR